MREALAARSDDDFIVEKPARQPRRRKAVADPGILRGALAAAGSAALRHPGRILGTILLVGCAGMIGYNALVLQKSRHRAPLFGKVVATIPAPVPPMRPQPTEHPGVASPEPAAIPPQAAAPAVAPATPAPAAATSAPPARTLHSPIGDLIRSGGEIAVPGPPPRPSPAGPAQTSIPAAAKPVGRDPMSDMIRMGGPVPVPPGTVGKAEPDAAITAAQRALAKLGYSVKVDGLPGRGTRQALETFEHDRHLPVTGELGPRTIRELAAQSGIPIQ